MQDTKSVVFIYINNEFTKKEIKKTISFTIAEEKRGFLWEQIGAGAEHPQHYPRRVTPLGGWRTPCKRGRKDCRSHRGGGHQENMPHQRNQEELTWAHRA